MLVRPCNNTRDMFCCHVSISQLSSNQTFWAVQQDFLTDVLNLNPNGAKVLSSKQQIQVTYPIHIDGTLMVTISPYSSLGGQDEIIVYDTRVPATLVQVQRYVVNTNLLVGSRADWEFYRSRWLSLDDGVGVLAIPLRVIDPRQLNPNGNFDGYMSYDISLAAGVYRHFNVSHVESKKYHDCYEYKAFAGRLIVINNGTTITTTKGHSIVSTNLKTGRNRWKLEAPNLSNRKCCASWYTIQKPFCPH